MFDMICDIVREHEMCSYSYHMSSILLKYIIALKQLTHLLDSTRRHGNNCQINTPLGYLPNIGITTNTKYIHPRPSPITGNSPTPFSTPYPAVDGVNCATERTAHQVPKEGTTDAPLAVGCTDERHGGGVEDGVEGTGLEVLPKVVGVG